MLASVCTPQVATVHVQPNIDVLSADQKTPGSGFGTGARGTAEEIASPVLISMSLSGSICHIVALDHNKGDTGSCGSTVRSMFEAES